MVVVLEEDCCCSPPGKEKGLEAGEPSPFRRVFCWLAGVLLLPEEVPGEPEVPGGLLFFLRGLLSDSLPEVVNGAGGACPSGGSEVPGTVGIRDFD